MAVEEEEKDRRKAAQPSTKESAESRRTSRKKPASEVGTALRTVYQKTVDEDIPPEMLDLLGKLG